MTAVLTTSPATPVQINGTTTLVGTGFADHRTRLKLDGVQFTEVCTVPTGTFSVPTTVGGAVATQTASAEQLVSGTWSSVATLSVSVINSGSSSSSGQVVTTNSVTIQNTTFTGADQLTAISGVSGAGTVGTPITNLTIQNCTFSNYRLGIYLTFFNTVIIQDCVIEDCDYAGIALFSCNTFTIQRCTIRRIGMIRTDFTDPALANNAYGIMWNRATENNNLATSPNSANGTIANNTVDQVPLWMGINGHGGDTIEVKNNAVTRCPRGIFVAGSPFPSGSGTVTHPLSINVHDNTVYTYMGRTGGTTESVGILYAGWQPTSFIQTNDIGTSFTEGTPPSIVSYTGEGNGSSTVTISGNTSNAAY